VNQILGSPEAKTDDGFSPCTVQADGYRTKIQHLNLPQLEGKSLLLVDTPGFEDVGQVSKSVDAVKTWLRSS
jgi:23S rRNA A2030 N6-methylase RlmJ